MHAHARTCTSIQIRTHVRTYTRTHTHTHIPKQSKSKQYETVTLGESTVSWRCYVSLSHTHAHTHTHTHTHPRAPCIIKTRASTLSASHSRRSGGELLCAAADHEINSQPACKWRASLSGPQSPCSRRSGGRRHTRRPRMCSSATVLTQTLVRRATRGKTKLQGSAKFDKWRVQCCHQPLASND